MSDTHTEQNTDANWAAGPVQCQVMPPFHDLFNAAMEESGLTNKEVAEHTGLSPAVISFLRNGRREPIYSTIKRILLVFPYLLCPDRSSELSSRIKLDMIRKIAEA